MEDIKRIEKAHVKGKEHLKQLKETPGNYDFVRDLEQQMVAGKAHLLS